MDNTFDRFVAMKPQTVYRWVSGMGDDLGPLMVCPRASVFFQRDLVCVLTTMGLDCANLFAIYYLRLLFDDSPDYGAYFCHTDNCFAIKSICMAR